MEDLRGKRVFITGGANGIGRSIVSAFCRVGAKVAFCDVNEKAGCDLCEGMTAAGYDCVYLYADVAQKADVENAMNTLFLQWDDIDIIVNNAGVSRFSPITETSVEDFDDILAINLRPVFITSKFLAGKREKDIHGNTYGRIINIASTRYLMSEPNSEGYAASKGGIVSLTHALAISLSKYRITVNCISPGWIETGDYGKLSEADHAQHPSGRVGVPDDIARTCLFLCEPANNFINGQNIIVDGGMTRKMIYEE